MRILLVRLRLLGDVVLTTPAVQLLRARFPDARIDYVIEPAYAAALQGLHEIDEVLICDRTAFRQQPRRQIGFLRELRRRRYDIAIDFHGGPRSGLITRASGARRRIGYTGPHSPFFYNCRIPRHVPGHRFHSVLQQIRLLEPLGIHAGTTIPRVTLAEPGEDSIRRAGEIAAAARSAGLGGIASLHIPPPGPFRNWGAGPIADLIGGLARLRLLPVLLGAADSHPVAAEVLACIRERTVSCVGLASLLDLRAIIAASRVFIGVDSGPMHVAATTATPVVAIFGPNLPAVSGPWSDQVTIVEDRSLDCRPCAQRVCRMTDFRCYRNVSADRVLEAVRTWLSAEPLSPPTGGLPASLYVESHFTPGPQIE